MAVSGGKYHIYLDLDEIELELEVKKVGFKNLFGWFDSWKYVTKEIGKALSEPYWWQSQHLNYNDDLEIPVYKFSQFVALFESIDDTKDQEPTLFFTLGVSVSIYVYRYMFIDININLYMLIVKTNQCP